MDQQVSQVGQPRETETLIQFDSSDQMLATLGAHDELLRVISGAYPLVGLHVRGNDLRLNGDPGQGQKALRVISEARTLAANGTRVSAQTIEQLVRMLESATAANPQSVLGMKILSGRGKEIRPKTENQKNYVEAIDENTVIFGIGPAGTGKTYLAMAKAVAALQAKEVSRIILTRPAVEAGEKLGFLPGTLTDKIDPYLRPLYDALHDMIEPDSMPRLLAAGTIEVAPLAYMRGRTLNDAFIILDEAQNTTPEQMKMFLTRLGFGSKIVITGDITQVDLPSGTKSGLRVVTEILEGVDDIAFCELDATDVVRHRLVGAIVGAYERWTVRQDPNINRSAARSRRRAATSKNPEHRTDTKRTGSAPANQEQSP
jgi:phosphate starvation-inducible PhoH-like protein